MLTVKINDIRWLEFKTFPDGYWCKITHDSNEWEIYFENSYSYWRKYEYDSNGNETYYYEDSIGIKEYYRTQLLR